MQSVFAKAIRRARVDKELTQAQLADRIGISGCHMSRIENTSRGVSESSFLRVAEALELPPFELLAYAYVEVG